MSYLKIGDLIKDNDPRMPNRVLQIVEIEGKKVVAQSIHGGRKSRISISNIRTHSWPLRSGFSLVASSEEAAP